MIDKELLEEPDEIYEAHEIHRFDPEEYNWDKIFELSSEPGASVVGKTGHLEGDISSYFISLTY